MKISSLPRLKEFENLIGEDEIDLKELKKFIHAGIPECAKYRALCWKLLFNYLSPKRREWETHLQRQRNNYNNLIKGENSTPLKIARNV
jgi:hypothetical protein